MKTKLLLPVITALIASTMACAPITTKTDIQPISTPTSQTNPYGDGIGAPHNVVQFPNNTYEWTLIHGD